MNLRFWKKTVSASPRVEVIRRDSLKLRLAEWRGDPKLVTEAGKVLSLEVLRSMLDVVRNENPINYVLPFGTSSNDRAAMQCRAEGYSMAIANLEAMGQSESTPEPLTADFAPEELPLKEPEGIQTA